MFGQESPGCSFVWLKFLLPACHSSLVLPLAQRFVLVTLISTFLLTGACVYNFSFFK